MRGAAGALRAALAGLGRRFASGAPARDPRFAAVQDSDLAFFERVLGRGGVVTEPHALEPFNRRVPGSCGQLGRAGSAAARGWGVPPDRCDR